MTKETRTDVQIYSAIAMLVAGVALATAGFIVPPTGEISDSVLLFFAQCLIYAGSIFGVSRKGHMGPPNRWKDIGYHFVIELDGSRHTGRPIEQVGAHCADDGHNRYSIGVAYVGGCAKDGKTPKDTRTPEQKEALAQLLCSLTRSVFLLLVFFSLISLAACRTMRVSEKAMIPSCRSLKALRHQR